MLLSIMCALIVKVKEEELQGMSWRCGHWNKVKAYGISIFSLVGHNRSRDGQTSLKVQNMVGSRGKVTNDKISLVLP